MAGIRQEKMAELIRRDLSVIFQRQASVWFGGMFISVTQVRMAPDLGLAKVYLSCLLYTSPSPRDVEESRMPSSA